MDDVAFGDALKALRTERGMTQQELAERAGVGHGKHVSSMECGHKDVHLSTLRRLAVALGCEASLLLTERGEKR